MLLKLVQHYKKNVPSTKYLNRYKHQLFVFIFDILLVTFENLKQSI